MTIKQIAEQFLHDHPYETGPMVQVGWFIFKISATGTPATIESLDFKKMASFTDDFSEAERIYSLQVAALAEFETSPTICTLQQSALVSLSYFPGCVDAYMERHESNGGNVSGWYVGVFNDNQDMDDPNSFTRRSLYELTIHDMRTAPYWLLPIGIVVSLAKDIDFERP